MLGEAIAAATVAFRGALDHGGDDNWALLRLAVAGMIVVFALWWLYFDRPAHNLLATLRTSLLWGYGHYFIFASAAAVGAGLAVAADHVTHRAEISGMLAGYAIAVPVAVYLFFVWLLHVRPHRRGSFVLAYPVGAVLALVTPLLPESMVVLAAILVVLAAILVVLVVVNATWGRGARTGSAERHQPG